MPMSKQAVEMTPKERMLLHLLSWLAKPNFFGPKPDPSTPHVTYDPPREGDLVICQTSGLGGPHPYLVGHVVHKHDDHRCVVRELGGERTCDISNERFYPIRGLKDDLAMLPEPRWRFYQKVRKAFARLDAYIHLFGGLSFDDEKVTVRVRERWGGVGIRKDDQGRRLVSVPYAVTMDWGPRTTIKAICEALEAAGFNEREFEYEPLADNKEYEDAKEG